MTWQYPKDVPALFKGWKEADQKRALEIANAAAEKGASSEEALFSAVKEVGHSRQTQLMLEAARLALIAAVATDAKEYNDTIGEVHATLELAASEFDPQRLADMQVDEKQVHEFLANIPAEEQLFGEVTDMVDLIGSENGWQPTAPRGTKAATEQAEQASDAEFDFATEDWGGGYEAFADEEEEPLSEAEKAVPMKVHIADALAEGYDIITSDLLDEGTLNRAEAEALDGVFEAALKAFEEGLEATPELADLAARRRGDEAPPEPHVTALGIDGDIVNETAKLTGGDKEAATNWLTRLVKAIGKKPAKKPFPPTDEEDATEGEEDTAPDAEDDTEGDEADMPMDEADMPMNDWADEPPAKKPAPKDKQPFPPAKGKQPFPPKKGSGKAPPFPPKKGKGMPDGEIEGDPFNTEPNADWERRELVAFLKEAGFDEEDAVSEADALLAQEAADKACKPKKKKKPAATAEKEYADGEPEDGEVDYYDAPDSPDADAEAQALKSAAEAVLVALANGNEAEAERLFTETKGLSEYVDGLLNA